MKEDPVKEDPLPTLRELRAGPGTGPAVGPGTGAAHAVR
ncbi:hypothetical protein SAMN06272737_10195 [Blastococcus mobilis]|uniref:Uncharacterized protein n=1 Tax=Blastococcus mobilis TaxID=1938746 RepID=A0A238UPG7_9ACTN|nr:hypothetical protein SAMN06272737_10195 [Blastococcus mobilis]